MGTHRPLIPSMLERFPSVDRPKVAFPTELVDFFLDMEERVLTRNEVKALIEKRYQANGQREGEFYQQEVCTGVDGTIIYITAHMFFEDLAKVQASLPPKDIIEDLNSKEEKQELDVDPQDFPKPALTDETRVGGSPWGEIKEFAMKSNYST